MPSLPRHVLHALATPLFLAPSVFLLACVSKPKPFELGPEAISRLSVQLGTPQISGCSQTVEPRWPFPGSHRNLRLLQLQQKNVLIYELINPNRSRTIWQPLAEDFSFEGDGIQLGQAAGGKTTDFEIIENRAGNLWSSYRFKAAGSNYYSAALEFVNTTTNAKLQRFEIPKDSETSVQQLWMLTPESATNDLSLVTKSYRFKKSSMNNEWQEDDFDVEFSWYVLSPESGRLQLMKRVTAIESKSDATQFVMGSASLEPLALTIRRHLRTKPEKSDRSEKSAEKGLEKKKTSETKILALRLFADAPRTSELFRSENSMLTALVVKSIPASALPGGQRKLHMAWVHQALATDRTSIQWLDLSLSPKGDLLTQLLERPVLSDSPVIRKTIHTVATRYTPANLEFRSVAPTAAPLPESRGTPPAPQVFLTWIAATNSELAYVATAGDAPGEPTATPQSPPTQRTASLSLSATVLANPDARSLGVSTSSADTGETFLLFGEFPDPRTARPERTAVNLPQEMGRIPVKMCAFTINKVREPKAETKAEAHDTAPAETPR